MTKSHLTLVCGETGTGKTTLIRERYGYRLTQGDRSGTAIWELSVLAAGECLAIEYPEVYLSQRVQANVAKEAVLAVKRGASVVLETHSQHLFNGVRLAIKRGELTPDDVELLYCQMCREPVQVDIDRDGRIENWPHGFMDEDLAFLSRFLAP